MVRLLLWNTYLKTWKIPWINFTGYKFYIVVICVFLKTFPKSVCFVCIFLCKTEIQSTAKYIYVYTSRKKDIFSIVKTSGKVRNVPGHSATAMQIMIVYKLSVINNNLSK